MCFVNLDDRLPPKQEHLNTCHSHFTTSTTPHPCPSTHPFKHTSAYSPLQVYLNFANSGDHVHHQRVLDQYSAYRGHITFVPYHFHHLKPFADQVVINMHALYTHKGVAEWMLSSDVDEFVQVMGGHDSLPPFLRRFNDAHDVAAIALAHTFWVCRDHMRHPGRARDPSDCRHHSLPADTKRRHHKRKLVVHVRVAKGLHVHEIAQRMRVLGQRVIELDWQNDVRLNHLRHYWSEDTQHIPHDFAQIDPATYTEDASFAGLRSQLELKPLFAAAPGAGVQKRRAGNF